MLKRLEKLKSKVQKHVANNKFKLKNILAADEWKFASFLNELLEQFSKNYALLPSVIPHAAVL